MPAGGADRVSEGARTTIPTKKHGALKRKYWY